MKGKFPGVLLLASTLILSCSSQRMKLDLEIYETSAGGHKLEKLAVSETAALPGPKAVPVEICLYPDSLHQSILGLGGAFTESSAWLLQQLSEAKRREVIEAYFGNEGARYSLTRTHINSCDFSLGNYSYAPVEDDRELEHFSIEEDRDDLLPMIHLAREASEEGFRILASPWTAPPWMKDNQDWKGGKLLPEYRESWALFFSRYLQAYRDEGIDIWALTVENEPLGNDSNWESMHMSADETVDFVNNFMAPRLREDGHEVKIIAYDQNRGEELRHWADVLYRDKASLANIDGIAVHWYASTYDWFPASLKYARDKAPEKLLIHTESCIDAEVPHWQDDAWYWNREATDWGWDWAPAESRHLHPKYVPVYRYARDIIGCFNSEVEGWIDWNMVLDRQGGPNWAKNWCVAPVIVDPDKDEVYYTPLYYTMVHFSRFIRPGAVRIGFEMPGNRDVMMTAVKNPDGSIAVVMLNMSDEPGSYRLRLGKRTESFRISPKAIQTLIIPAE